MSIIVCNFVINCISLVKMFKTILLVIPLIYAQELNTLESMQIKNLQLMKCWNTSNDPVSLKNITVEIGDQPKFLVSGIFSTLVDLNPKITAAIELYRKVLLVWVEVPCERNLGSCTYSDLCSYGVPKNQSCPDVFIRNKVPCRCPIKKGIYVLPKTIEFEPDTSILSGTYKGTVTVSSNHQRLACYHFSFVLYDVAQYNSIN